MARYLEQLGYPSSALAANNVYRADPPYGRPAMLPDISLRYLAVRSGIGHFGLSGNVIHPVYGAAIIIGGLVTTAELSPTDPLPAEKKYCDQCRLCMASCASGMMSPQEETTVHLGGYDFTYAKRRTYFRCEYVCGGFTGLHSSGKWSTWSPGRLPIPEEDKDFMAALVQGVQAFKGRPQIKDIGYYYPALPPTELKVQLTCGNCQLVCCPDKEERKARYQRLTQGGVVIQTPDGTLKTVTPEEAKTFMAEMDPARRKFYENN
jgi:epoxyqueuosine reductase QueG